MPTEVSILSLSFVNEWCGASVHTIDERQYPVSFFTSWNNADMRGVGLAMMARAPYGVGIIQYRPVPSPTRRTPLHCPFCQHDDTRVVDTRVTDDGSTIRRRRECAKCRRRFTTLETSSFSVEKRSGVVEPFSRDKVTAGVRKACQGRPVSEHDLAVLAQQVEECLRVSGQPTVSADEVGKAVLPFLRNLDEVAYLRFASVYSSFQSLEDFEEAIRELRR